MVNRRRFKKLSSPLRWDVIFKALTDAGYSRAVAAEVADRDARTTPAPEESAAEVKRLRAALAENVAQADLAREALIDYRDGYDMTLNALHTTLKTLTLTTRERSGDLALLAILLNDRTESFAQKIAARRDHGVETPSGKMRWDTERGWHRAKMVWGEVEP